MDIYWKNYKENLIIRILKIRKYNNGYIYIKHIPTGPDWTNNSHIRDSVTLSSNPPTYIVASKSTGKHLIRDIKIYNIKNWFTFNFYKWNF